MWCSAPIADVEQFSQAVPGILRVEFLTDVKSGVGARFRETRMMMGREASTELEVTEYAENEHVRLVSEAGGTLWDTVFTTVSDGEGTALKMVMDAQPQSASARDDAAAHHRRGPQGGRAGHGRGEGILRGSFTAVDQSPLEESTFCGSGVDSAAGGG